MLTAIKENLRFLVIKVTKQLEDTRRLVEDPTEALVDKIAARDDYVDNLKSMIDNQCFRMLGDERIDKRTVDLLRAVGVVASNLERVGDFAVNTVEQLRYLRDRTTPLRFGPAAFFDEILGALDGLDEALFARTMSQALKICRSEFAVDGLYEAVFRRIMDELRAGGSPEDLVTALFIYRYLERMADALLNIGEAVIFAAVGERLRVSEYQALEETLASAQLPMRLSDATYEGIWASKSGCRIGTLRDRTADPGPDAGARWVVFKEGPVKKVLEEKEALETWERLCPGVPPRVHGLHRHDDRAALLVEYLWGHTLQRVVLDRPPREVQRALLLVFDLLGDVWTRTLEPTPLTPRFLKQLEDRLEDVLEVHPDFRFPVSRIGGLVGTSFDDLLRRAHEIDAVLQVPFRVLIHGDFNLDNVIVDLERDRVHFIDLHRTRAFDYVQDVTVFVVSGFRMPAFDEGLRRRLDHAGLELYRFGRAFAERQGDRTYDARVALGLARSFLTSTRFELDERFSRVMLHRAVYLLERVIDHRGAWEDFHLAEDVLVY